MHACAQPPWNLTIRAPLLDKYVSAYNARLLRHDPHTLLATFQVRGHAILVSQQLISKQRPCTCPS